MIAKLPPYPDYKPSSVEWLGDVPSHWEVQPLKHWLGINTRVLSKATDPNFNFRYLEIGAISDGVLIEEPRRILFADAPSRARRVVESGDTIVSTVRPYLKAVWFANDTYKDLVCSTGFAVLSPQWGTVPKYVGYMVQSSSFTNQMTADSVGTAYPAISEGKFGSLQVCVPPLPEQHAIARYLDHVDRRIQRYIEAKEKLIALLQEARQATIQRAVTRGLAPDVPLKPSGLDWLGDVPAHWEVRRLKDFVTDCVNGVWGSDPNGVDDLPCVRVADFDRQRLRVRMDRPTMRAIAPNKRGQRMLEKGDLLLEKSGGGDRQPVGVVMLYDHDAPAVSSNFIARLPVREGFEPTFVLYLHSTLYALRINTRSIKQTTGIQNLDSSEYLGEKVGIPSLPEQTAIATHLDQATATIDRSIDNARRQSERMAEYRSSLIAHVVTGKLDVRAAAAQLPAGTPVPEQEKIA